MVGRDGAVNAASALDGGISMHRGMIQVARFASVINAGTLRSMADEFVPLRSLLMEEYGLSRSGRSGWWLSERLNANLRTPLTLTSMGDQNPSQDQISRPRRAAVQARLASLLLVHWQLLVRSVTPEMALQWLASAEGRVASGEAPAMPQHGL
jgi:hypothetical protein